MRLVVVDPGGYSGLVRVTIHGEQITVKASALGPEDHHSELHHLLLEEWCDSDNDQFVLIYERFDHRNREAALLISVEYIGVIKDFAQETFDDNRPITLVRQGSDQAKSFATDDKLIRMGLPFQTPKSKKPQKDMNDALRHFVYFVIHNKLAPTHAKMALLNKLKPR
jgi:hypothetical protein